MTKQELFKQADYNFQRGNRELAREYILEYLKAYPQEEAAWMLLARIVEEQERKIECYACVLKINPRNNEARINLMRLKSNTKPLPRKISHPYPWQTRSYKRLLRGVILVVVLLVGLGTTTFAIALNAPQSSVGKILIPATPTPFDQKVAANIAAETRSEINASYPQYSALVDTLLAFGMNNAENGMDGAPERPGVQIVPSDGSAQEALSKLKGALPQPGSLSTVTLSEQQVTSLLAMGMKNNPDLPLSDVQVFLREGNIQIWGTVKGASASASTAALVVGTLVIDGNNNPQIQIESIQIGKQVVPDVLVSQTASWLNQLLLDKINAQLPGLKIMNINISSGQITVSGMR